MNVVFTRNEAKGALPNGTRICKTCSQPGDTHPDGTQGTVIGSMGPVFIPEFPNDAYFYFVEWDSLPGLPCGIAQHRIARVS